MSGVWRQTSFMQKMRGAAVMENRKLDKIMLRIGLVLTVIAVICVIIVPKSSAEFIISLISLGITLTMSIIAGIRVKSDKDKK